MKQIVTLVLTFVSLQSFAQLTEVKVDFTCKLNQPIEHSDPNHPLNGVTKIVFSRTTKTATSFSGHNGRFIHSTGNNALKYREGNVIEGDEWVWKNALWGEFTYDQETFVIGAKGPKANSVQLWRLSPYIYWEAFYTSECS